MLLEIPRIEHLDATSIQDAVASLRAYGEDAQVIAGSTDLLALLKDRIEGPSLRSPDVLVNVKTIPELAEISYRKGIGLRIGAAVTLRHLAESEAVRGFYPMLVQAALSVGTTQIRNMGTIGGNLCQRPRCAYFRHPHFVCIKKGGLECYALTGDHRWYHSIIGIGTCVAANPSDMAVPLVALGATVLIAAPEGERRLPLTEFYAAAGSLREINLRRDEILVSVEVPDVSEDTRQIFLKQRIRKSVDWALASVAAVARVRAGVCEDATIVLGGVSPAPVLAVEAAPLLRGRRLSDDVVAEAAGAALAGARPLKGNGYKVSMSKALIRRALLSLA